MFGLRLTSEVQKRWKNGRPHQRTTGVDERELNPDADCAISAQSTSMPDHAAHGNREKRTVRTRLTQKRRVMSRSSGFSSMAAVTVRGSRAMPQIGQEPGLGAHDLGMHRAGVFGARGRDGDVGLQGHAARRTGTRLALAHFGTHRAHVGAAGIRLPDFGPQRAVSAPRHSGASRPKLFRYVCGDHWNFSRQLGTAEVIFLSVVLVDVFGSGGD